MTDTSVLLNLRGVNFITYDLVQRHVWNKNVHMLVQNDVSVKLFNEW